MDKNVNIVVIGLGYVGLPLAVEFAKKYNVVGFDTNKAKIDNYLSGIDVTKEVGNESLIVSSCNFTSHEDSIAKGNFIVVAVPTPINSDKTPDLTPVVNASKTVGRNLKKGSIVVYESTVYPGTTEEICIPILEKESGLTFGVDFTVGYSPERINPGDKINTLTKIVKIVSGSDNDTLEKIAKVYGSIIEAGVYKAESIKVAEAAKVIENSQRDINIAFMNELSMIFNMMEIDTKSVLEAASTKWNFLNFKPGLVGGHCIGVDPYYFTYKAEQLGYHSQIILSGRKINDDMGKFVANNVIKQMIKADLSIKNANVAIMGITFKENCSDVRNTKVIDIVKELKEFGINVLIYDPVANSKEVETEYGVKLVRKEDLINLSAIIVAVAHDDFKENLSISDLRDLYSVNNKVLIDIKGIYNRIQMISEGFKYWSL